MGTDRNTEGGTLALGTWWTATQACEHLGITPRALRKRVQAGTVERRRLGRKSLYCLGACQGNKGTGEPRPKPKGALLALRGTGPGAAIAPALEACPELPADPDLVPRLVAQLTTELGKAREERGEALAIGFALAEQRDTLAGELAAVKARLAALARDLETCPWYARTRRAAILADLARLV